MQQRLIETNQDLLHQLSVLKDSLGRARVASMMDAFVRNVVQICNVLEQEVKRQLKDLEYGLEDALPYILAATQDSLQLFDLVNTRLASPITRYDDEDRLALSILQWLHEGHELTGAKPFAISDGGFAIYPTPEWPVVYLLPSSKQRTLLYLPLLFHEFGHLLYACRKPELDDLVHDFQSSVARVLAPKTIRDRGGMRPDDFVRQAIVSAWYSWAQELYCDAVGLTIGGPCFLKVFSHYFRFRSVRDYYLPRSEQLKSRHPVTRLRIRMLLDRAREHGFPEVVDGIEETWTLAARLLGVDEDYEGTWVEGLYMPLRRMLDDMLEETQPRDSREAEVNSPLSTIDKAWTRFEEKDQDFRTWESMAIDRLLQNLER